MDSPIYVQKTNNPMRQLINFNEEPICKIANILAPKLRKFKMTKNKQNQKYSINWIQHLKQRKLVDNIALTSFDIINLYTNIPIGKEMNIITDKIKK